jgi:hypothetical protein
LARPIAILLAVVSSISCGSRTTLLVESQSLDASAADAPAAQPDSGGRDGTLLDSPPLPDTTQPDAGKPDAKTDGPAADAQPDADAALEAEASPPVHCKLQPNDGPVVAVAFPDRHATAPSVAVVDPGVPAGAPGAHAAEVAVQAFASGGSSSAHPDVHVARVRIDEPWPTGMAMVKAPVLIGYESHGWAEMTRAAGGKAALAFAWHTDQGGLGRPAFRLLDVASWSGGAGTDVVPKGEAVLSLADGAGVGAFGVGYAGSGYAVVWRDHMTGDAGVPNATRPLVAVLDEAGNVTLGPHAAAAPTPYPGRSPVVVWSGSAYLVATSARTCEAADPLCEPRSVVVSRVRPASGDAWDDSGIDRVSVIPALAPGASPSRPSIAQFGGTTWVGWFEGNPDDAKAPRTPRLQRFNPIGEPIGASIELAHDAHPTTRIALSASAIGVLATWIEDGNTSLPATQLGRTKLVAYGVALDSVVLGPAVRIDATMNGSYGWTSSVATVQPRAFIVSWTGRAAQSAKPDVTYLARIDCLLP